MSAQRSSSSEESFRSLCRSSPWRWETLRFTITWRAPSAEGIDTPAPLKAWVRRPAALRVEAADGTLLHSTTGNETSRDALYVSATRKSWLLAPRLVTPVYDDAGLVRRRPEAAYGEVVFGDPRWSSMLDPVELAGSSPVAMAYPGANRVEVLDLAEETFAGRPVLAATVTRNASYEPAAPGRPLVGEGHTRVLIDVGTAVCVSTTALDGPSQGAGHDLHLLGVDEYLTDDYFRAAPPELSDVSRHVPWVVG
ncbi:hypothetical protein FDK12_06790 [Arthrobacter sp. NamB2]|uniref:hypothetical protein n=1 Tax=Arthrobacter sp. NamB2 TaxID=2576035 RepID=UPI0010C99D8F|nr:hypothetical protein [Arthrobacter sp. NamB2]TKV28372.1 hypothetical protein FDK12_06790 [Arthrobacter sp. NamB2]